MRTKPRPTTHNFTGEGPVSGDILRGGYMQRPLFGFGVPTHDDTGSYSGLASFALSSVRVANFLKDQASALEGDIYLVDQQGKVIAHPNELMAASFANLSNSPAVRAMLNDPNQAGSVAYTGRDGQHLAGYARVPGLNWGVVVERPAALALSGVYAGREIAFMLLMVSLVATSVAGSLLAAWLIGPLEALSKAMTALAHGQSGPALPQTSFTEMQRLGISFGRLRSALALQTQRREQTMLELQQAKEGLEARVAERTSALRTVNRELKNELQNRDRLEKELVEKNQSISDILDSVSDGFIALDNHFRVMYTNRQATPDGMRQEDIIGVDVWKVFPEFQSIVTETGYMQMAKDSLPPELDIHEAVHDNWFHVRIFPSMEGLSIYWVDVTESKRAEIEREQRQAHVRQLVDISEKILSINTIEGLLQTLVDSARSLMGAGLAIAGYGFSENQFRLGAVSSDVPFPASSPIQIGQIFPNGSR